MRIAALIAASAAALHLARVTDEMTEEERKTPPPPPKPAGPPENQPGETNRQLAARLNQSKDQPQ